jgi:hypothetical protein
MNSAIYLGAVVVVVLLGVFVVMSMGRDRLAKKGLEQLKAELGGEGVLSGTVATFQGRASHGANQVTGLGALVLTARQLVFEMLAPQRRLAISLGSVSDADRPEELGPKSPALAVYFRDEKAAVNDVAIWLVDDVDGWVRRIREARLRATMGDDPRPPGWDEQ